jgi:hypothetical protein
MVSEHGAMSESFVDEYKPPQFNADQSIIVPNDYLVKRHRLEPRPKGKSLFA